MISWMSLVSRRASLRILTANSRTIAGSSAALSIVSARSDSAPMGVFSSCETFTANSRLRRLGRALLGVVVRDGEGELVVDRREAHVDDRHRAEHAAAHLDVLLDHLARRPCLLGKVGDRRVQRAIRPGEAERGGRVIRVSGAPVARAPRSRPTGARTTICRVRWGTSVLATTSFLARRLSASAPTITPAPKARDATSHASGVMAPP